MGGWVVGGKGKGNDDFIICRFFLVVVGRGGERCASRSVALIIGAFSCTILKQVR